MKLLDYGKSLKFGDKFTRLTVQHWDKSSKSWICKCDCGKITKSRANQLKNGKHKSCGCLVKDLGRLKSRLENDTGPKRDVFRNYKCAAKRRNYDWRLSEDKFFELIIENCHYCDSPPDMCMKGIFEGRNFRYNGVDRIDNTIGYVEGNVVTCCKICNNAKSTLTLDEFKNWISRIHNHLHIT